MNFKSLEIVDAVTTGWHADLNMTEFRVLNWIASKGGGRGARPGYPFTWTVRYGMDDWAAFLAMPERSMFRALKSLQAKGVITKIPASKPVYGISTQVAMEAVSWNVERKDMGAFLRAARLPELTVDAAGALPTMAEPTANIETPTPPLTRGNAPQRKQERKKEKEENPLKRGDACGAAPCNTEGDPMSDGWDAPSQEEPDTFSVPSDHAKPKRPPAKTTVLCDKFEQEWLTARTQRRMLATPWGSRAAFQANLKKLLKLHTAEEIETMIVVFFRQVVSGGVVPVSDELWKDFWNTRARLAQIAAGQSAPSELTLEEQIEAINERNRQRRLENT